MDMKEMLTVVEAAEILRVNRRTITHMIEDGKIKAQNVGLGKERKYWRIPISEIERIKNGSAQ